jgi:Ca2+-binding RTX toxin-like protein
MAIILGTAGNDFLSGTFENDTIKGLGGDDGLEGNGGNDSLEGGAGNDNLTCSSFDDTLKGGSGTDFLDGGGGNDFVDGGTGDDFLIGNFGDDTYVVDSLFDSITEYSSSDGTDLVRSSVSWTLGNFLENLTLTGTASIDGTGNGQANTIIGNGGNNVLSGNGGNDSLTGGALNDTLNGGPGRDTLTGGADNDVFVFRFGQSKASAADRITDFTIGSDKIDLIAQNGAALGQPSSFTRAKNSNANTITDLVNQVFIDANGQQAGQQALGINAAALVKVTGSSIAGTYLIVNDNTAGFQANTDTLVNLTGYKGTLPDLGPIAVNNFFV